MKKYLMEYNMTYDEFKNDILNAIKNKHPQWRDGQMVFNYINDKYNVAKDVAIKDMKKINIAELLKDCPQGMELYSPLCGDCKLYDVNNYMIRIETPNKDTLISLYHDGRYYSDGEIMLFPKGKTTWEGFVPPCKFEDGDVVVAETSANIPQQLFLLKHVKYREDNNGYDGYCYFGWNFQDNRLFEEGNWGFNRLATEEEKLKLFDAIKENGYKWNAEAKTLEKLIEPKFKVGDRIKKKGENSTFTITDVNEAHYFCGKYVICDTCDNNWELVPNKFDINTLVSFESKVLARDSKEHKWVPAMWGYYDNTDKDFPYKTIGSMFKYCIPYNDNTKHLLGTADDCADYYKTWE